MKVYQEKVSVCVVEKSGEFSSGFLSVLYRVHGVWLTRSLKLSKESFDWLENLADQNGIGQIFIHCGTAHKSVFGELGFIDSTAEGKLFMSLEQKNNRNNYTVFRITSKFEQSNFNDQLSLMLSGYEYTSVDGLGEFYIDRPAIIGAYNSIIDESGDVCVLEMDDDAVVESSSYDRKVYWRKVKQDRMKFAIISLGIAGWTFCEDDDDEIDALIASHDDSEGYQASLHGRGYSWEEAHDIVDGKE